jgi:hypothetical protein
MQSLSDVPIIHASFSRICGGSKSLRSFTEGVFAFFYVCFCFCRLLDNCKLYFGILLRLCCDASCTLSFFTDMR